MTLHRRRFLGLLAAGAASAVGGCLDTSGQDGDPTDDVTHRTTVTIRDGEFTPASLEAAAGHDVTVVFENSDEREHVLRGDFGDFEVTVPPGATVSQEVTVPNQPGDYGIGCEASESVFELEAVPADVLDGCSLGDTDE